MDIINIAVIAVAAVAVESGALAIDSDMDDLPGEDIVIAAPVQRAVPAQFAFHIHKAFFNTRGVNFSGGFNCQSGSGDFIAIHRIVLDGVHASAELPGGGKINDELFING